MFKLFSIEEANNMIPQVDALMGTMQEDLSDILRLRQEIADASSLSIEARNKAQELHFLVRDVQDIKVQLDNLGVFVKDVNAGLVEIPSQVGAEVVYLTWEKGQDSITHYHRLNEGTHLPLNVEPTTSSSIPQL
ncbi:MAG: DUF2203 domain-containing protein [Trueperaceae bacterium]|nr:DUF2203 domain-containing protein [Trueperaceae bacterium]